TMTIRTADLLVGIRGTCGWVDAEKKQAALLEGKIRCAADGERANVSAGEKVLLGEDGQLTVTPLTVRDVPEFVRAEFEEDEDFRQEILDDIGLDVCAEPAVLPRSGQAVTIADGGAQAVVKADGTLWMKGCIWGNNNQNYIDIYGWEWPEEFVPVRENVSAVCVNGERAGGSDVSNSTTAVIDNDGVLWMWGDGYLGDGVEAWERTTSEPVRVMENVQAVSMGHDFTAALQTDGSLWAWGWGVLGNGTAYDGWSSQVTPVKVMDGVAAVSTCGDTTAVIKTDGSLWMWGYNEYGQLGTGSTEGNARTEWGDSYQRTPVKVMDDVAAVSVSLYHTAAIKTDGSLWTWGLNDCGQLGNGRQGNGTVTQKYIDREYFHDDDYDAALRSVVQPIQTLPVKVMDGVQAVCASIINTEIVLEDGSWWRCGVSEGGDETAIHIYITDMDYGEEVSIWSTPVKVQASNVAGVSGNLTLGRDGTVWYRGEPVFEGAAIPET
ncbi:MAG: hypothetical protein HFF78_07815, partial [Oscillospiraceae bacterium]|nr:hypothetical protein [Oscillospiraceae bacterium]